MKKSLALGASLIISVLALTACGGSQSTAAQNQGQQALDNQQQQSNNALASISRAEPVPVLHDSSDAHNQRLFYTIQSDPNKIEYLTLIGLDGTPYAHFTIKGQVSSMNTQLTNPVQSTCQDGTNGSSGYGIACTSIGQPEPNGVYLGPDEGHFAFTTSGALVEWEGNFIESDQPVNLQAPVKLSLNENVPPSTTNLGNVQGGALPNGRTH